MITHQFLEIFNHPFIHIPYVIANFFKGDKNEKIGRKFFFVMKALKIAEKPLNFQKKPSNLKKDPAVVPFDGLLKKILS